MYGSRQREDGSTAVQVHDSRLGYRQGWPLHKGRGSAQQSHRKKHKIPLRRGLTNAFAPHNHVRLDLEKVSHRLPVRLPRGRLEHPICVFGVPYNLLCAVAARKLLLKVGQALQDLGSAQRKPHLAGLASHFGDEVLDLLGDCPVNDCVEVCTL
jgi:hypothetical protein